MRKLIAAVASVTAIAALAVPALASAAGGTTTCNGDIGYWQNGQSAVVNNLDVPAGATCHLFGVDVAGNVSVEGTLSTFGTHVHGNVTVNTGGQFKNSNATGVTIDKNLTFNTGVGSDNGFFSAGDSYIGQNLNYFGSTPLFVGYGTVHVAGNATITGGASALYSLDVHGSRTVS